MLNIYSSATTTPSILSNIYQRETSFNGTTSGHNHSFSISGTPTGQSTNNDLTIGTSTSNQSLTTVLQQPVIGDITEPFWVQSTNEGAVWGDPDDLCLSEAKRLISSNDKKIFWEMARTYFILYSVSISLGVASAECTLQDWHMHCGRPRRSAKETGV
mmetsp:Transcript_3067/g.4672  ORF Transcript_3067/g.4672 Transcript_3067/m.4672 type:complete len:158 (+) Transcript_3067:188-661(+)